LIENAEVIEMKLEEKLEYGLYRYSADISFSDGGEYGYTFRVLPFHPDLINKFETGLIRWVVQ